MAATVREVDTLGTVQTEGRRRLHAAAIPNATLDARVLLSHLLDLDRAQLFNREAEPAPSDLITAYDDLITRRIARVPVSRLMGRREFWSLEFEITADTLDPRPDSETLIEALLAALLDQTAALSILDLGTGSGCLLLAALSEYPNAAGLGIDLNQGATTTAARNAERLGLSDRSTFQTGNWTDGLSGRFDVVLCNPPYITSDALAGLAPEVIEYDPVGALDGGPDGLRDYRRVIATLPSILADDGLALIELGQGQRAEVTALAEAAMLSMVTCRADLAGIERCLVLTRRPR